jgi:hypothetical protein
MSKKTYKIYKDVAHSDDVTLATSKVKIYTDVDCYNGVSIAWRVAAPKVAEPRMLQVAVSYCATEDKYKRKLGKMIAMDKLYDGQFIQLPLANKLNYESVEDISEYLLDMFSV